jgi:hypothetical protein
MTDWIAKLAKGQLVDIDIGFLIGYAVEKAPFPSVHSFAPTLKYLRTTKKWQLYSANYAVYNFQRVLHTLSCSKS